MEGATIQTALAGAISTPDLSQISAVNADGYQCDKCPEGKTEANCWNVDVAPYQEQWNTWKGTEWPRIQQEFARRESTFDYGQIEIDSLRLAEWAQTVQRDLNLHKKWLQDMDNNVNLKKRCCVTRNPFQRNIERLKEANNAMRRDIESWKDEAISYAVAQGLTADELEEQGIQSEKYQNELTNQIDNVASQYTEQTNRERLIFGGLLAGAVLLIIFLARR